MPSLSRARIENLKVQGTATIGAALIASKYYRENPDAAARMTKRHVDAHVEVNRANGKRGKQS